MGKKEPTKISHVEFVEMNMNKVNKLPFKTCPSTFHQEKKNMNDRHPETTKGHCATRGCTPFEEMYFGRRL